MLRYFCVLLFAVLILTVCSEPTQAASAKKTGTYQKVWESSNIRNGIPPTYSVVVHKVTKKKAVLYVEWISTNGSAIYVTNKITAKRKGKTATFDWKDTWGNAGTGRIAFGVGYVKLKMTQTEASSWNRGTLDTGGKYMKLKKKNNKKKIPDQGI